MEGYFISPGRNPYRTVVSPREFDDIVVSDEMDEQHGIKRRDDMEQILIPWTTERERVFGIGLELEPEKEKKQEKKRSPFEKKNKKKTKQHESGQDVYSYEGKKQAAEQYVQTLDTSFGMW